MSKPNSFIYINLNSLAGKYTAAALIVGNIVIIKNAYNLVHKFTNKKKENDQ